MILKPMLIALVAVARPIAAQTIDPAVSALKTEWDMTAGFLQKAVEQMPESEFRYRPVATVRSFGEIIRHVIATQNVLCGVALGERALRDGDETGPTTKVELAKQLRDSIEYCKRAYAQDLSRVATDNSKREDRYWALAHNTAHNGEHYGNIATYMRMNGLVPPSSQR